MMLSLKDREWGEFQIGSLFDIKIGKSIDANKVNIKMGKNAYITRKESNNGLDGFLDYDKDYLNTQFPVITIGNETAEPFVQTFPFFTGTKVNILSSKKSVSPQALLFVAQSIRMNKSKYSYTFTINSTRLKKQNILLPLDKNGLPDWQFMEQYIREREKVQLKDYTAYVEKVLADIGDVDGVLPLKEKEWRAFHIEEIAKIEPGRDIYDAERRIGDTPYISSTSINNGIAYYVSNDNSTKEANCISVNRNGSVGYAFYHPYEALYSNDCRKLRLNQPSKYASIFIAHQIKKQREKYSYGYKMGTARLKRQLILLPINECNEPDWTYMERYTKSLMKHQLRTYLHQKDLL